MNANYDFENIPDQILDLITRKATGTLSQEDEELLISWIKINPHLKGQYEEFLNQMNNHYLIYLSNQRDGDKAWRQIKKRIKPATSHRSLYLKIAAYAATIMLLIAISWLLSTSYFDADETVAESIEIPERSNEAVLILSNGNHLTLNESGMEVLNEDGNINIINKPGEVLSYESKGKQSEHLVFNKLIVPLGARYQLKLSDGTRVWLNAGSEIEYPVSFGAGERKVSIKGEVYFDVKTDPEWPFIISVNSYEVKALGTAFNVSSYDEDTFFQTALIEGKVEITGRRGQKLMLNPGQLVNIIHESQATEVSDVDTRFYTSWKDGILHFNKVTLAELMVKLERWYDVKIVFENPKKKELIYSGAMENSRNIEFLLNLIEKTADVKFELNEQAILVK
ncbi:MAG: FecR domain-containing protein [Bacteroidales bacterium]